MMGTTSGTPPGRQMVSVCAINASARLTCNSPSAAASLTVEIQCVSEGIWRKSSIFWRSGAYSGPGGGFSGPGARLCGRWPPAILNIRRGIRGIRRPPGPSVAPAHTARIPRPRRTVSHGSLPWTSHKCPQDRDQTRQHAPETGSRFEVDFCYLLRDGCFPASRKRRGNIGITASVPDSPAVPATFHDPRRIHPPRVWDLQPFEAVRTPQR